MDMPDEHWAFKEKVKHLKATRTGRKRVAAAKVHKARKKQQSEKALPTGILVFIEDGAMGPDQRQAADIVAAAKGMTIVPDRHRARAFVCSRCDALSSLTIWAAILNGGTICDATYFCNDGKHGGAVFHQALLTQGPQRILWLSASFQRDHNMIADIIKNSAGRPDSKWAIVGRAAFAHAVVRNQERKNARNLEQIGLVSTPEEIAALGLSSCLYTTSSFIDNFLALKIVWSQRVACRSHTPQISGAWLIVVKAKHVRHI